jgi:hypothetical protein
MSEITHILSGMEQGERQAAEQLLPLLYDELRRLATEKMAQERQGQTLQAMALVHEPTSGGWTCTSPCTGIVAAISLPQRQETAPFIADHLTRVHLGHVKNGVRVHTKTGCTSGPPAYCQVIRSHRGNHVRQQRGGHQQSHPTIAADGVTMS